VSVTSNELDNGPGDGNTVNDVVTAIDPSRSSFAPNETTTEQAASTRSRTGQPTGAETRQQNPRQLRCLSRSKAPHSNKGWALDWVVRRVRFPRGAAGTRHRARGRKGAVEATGLVRTDRGGMWLSAFGTLYSTLVPGAGSFHDAPSRLALRSAALGGRVDSSRDRATKVVAHGQRRSSGNVSSGPARRLTDGRSPVLPDTLQESSVPITANRGLRPGGTGRVFPTAISQHGEPVPPRRTRHHKAQLRMPDGHARAGSARDGPKTADVRP
jgi:hypothetical protein